MSKILDTEFVILDTAVGPTGVLTQTIEDFDIDDYVHTTVLATARTYQLRQKALTASPKFAKNRIPVQIGNVGVGGY